MSYRRFHLSEVFGAPYVGTRRLNQKPWFADDQPQLRPETTRKVSQRRIPKMTKLQTRRSTHKTDPHENGELYLGIGHQNGDSCPPSAFEWAPTPEIPSHLALGIPHATADAPIFFFSCGKGRCLIKEQDIVQLRGALWEQRGALFDGTTS